MKQFAAKILYGSQNYNLATAESDKDYKWIQIPSIEDLFYRNTLNSQMDDNNSIWDFRDFGKYILKANPNALELVFSTEIEYFNSDFKELMLYIRNNCGSLIRKNWKDFSSAVYGIGLQSSLRNGITPKTVSRAVYFFLLWLSLTGDAGEKGMGTNGEMTEETWRSITRVWPQQIRSLDPNSEDLYQNLNYIKENWKVSDWSITPKPYDEIICKNIEQVFMNYLQNHLTSN